MLRMLAYLHLGRVAPELGAGFYRGASEAGRPAWMGPIGPHLARLVPIFCVGGHVAVHYALVGEDGTATVERDRPACLGPLGLVLAPLCSISLVSCPCTIAGFCCGDLAIVDDKWGRPA